MTPNPSTNPMPMSMQVQVVRLFKGQKLYMWFNPRDEILQCNK